MPLPTELYSAVHSKQIPSSVPWSRHIRYTFPSQHDGTYRFPYSPSTFWVNFKIGTFYQNGNSKTESVRARLYVITAEGQESNLISWKFYHPHKWYSTRWALPSLPQSGIYIQLDPSQEERSIYRMELQGFEHVYQGSAHYVVMDEEDRPTYLFKYEQDVKTGRIQGGDIGSIHYLFDNEELPTHGLDRNEIDGIPLFPLGSQREYVYHT